MSSSSCLARLAACLGMGVSLCPAAEDPPPWNEFRGPNGSGVSELSSPPVELAERVAWSQDLPPGQSSPVLFGPHLYLTALENQKDLVTLAFNRRTGERVWEQRAPLDELEKVHPTNSPASSTPYADDTGLYVYFGSYGLLAYHHDGTEKWRKPIPTPESLYGMSTSPIAHGDHVILVLDNDANLPNSELSQSKLIAVDRATGETAWETDRPFVRSGWSTPTLFEDEIVVLGHGRAYGYDADTGTEKWFVNGFSRETIARPVIGRGHVFVSASMLGGVSDDQPDREPFWTALLPFDTNQDGKLERSEMTGHFTFPLRPDLPIGHSGFGIPLPREEAKREERRDGFMKGVDKNGDGFWTREEFLDHLSFDRGKPSLMAIRPGGEGNVTDSHVTWALHKNVPEIPSPIFHQDRLYLVRDGGILSAIDAANGEVIYRRRLNGASGHYRASPVIAGNHLYIVSNEGVVSVVRTGDEFRAVDAFELKEMVYATPAVDRDTLYVRTEKRLIAFREERAER